jgi:hypothetical protein
VCALLTCFVVAACSDDVPEPQNDSSSGEPRSFEMGFSSLPPELTEEAYEDAFRLFGESGDVVLIQRVPPWEDLIRDEISEQTAETTTRETELAASNKLDVFFAIDPTDVGGGRAGLAGLPDDMQGAGFEDERVRRALVSYAQYVAVNYQPKYLAIGVEMNTYYDHQPQDFEHFETLYEEAYDGVKEVAPGTLVFPTFQLERMQGRLPDGERADAQWSLLDRFEPRLDVLAVSSYPGLVFEHPGEIPDSYYSRLSTYSDRPIAIAQTGYQSGPGRASQADDSELEQANFVMRMLDDTESLEMQFVVWFTAWDPPIAAEPPFDLLQHLGLLYTDGSEKVSWSVWMEAASRPLAGASSAARP